MKPRALLNPLALVAAKQLVGDDDCAKIELPVLILFDAAKRGQLPAAGVNFLTTHLIIASYIAARTRSKAFHDCVTRAYDQLRKAAARPTALLDLTTTEYTAIRAALALYLRAIPKVEVGMMTAACAAAHKLMEA